MKKLRINLIIGVLAFFSINANASIADRHLRIGSSYWTTDICMGSIEEYYLQIENGSDWYDIKGNSYRIYQYNGDNAIWEDKTTPLNPIIISAPYSTNQSKLTFSVNPGNSDDINSVNMLRPGSYKIVFTIIYSATKEEKDYYIVFNVYDESKHFSIDTDIELDNGEGIICPSDDINYTVSLLSDGSDKAVSSQFNWTLSGDDSADGIEDESNTSLTTFVSFYNSHPFQTDYKVIAQSLTCKGTEMILPVNQSINEDLGDITGDFNMCSGGVSVYTIGTSTLPGYTYNWNITDGNDRVSSTTINGYEFTIHINDIINGSEKVSFEVEVNDGCNPKTYYIPGDEIQISNLEVQANEYINTDQSTKQLDVCYNSPLNDIIGPSEKPDDPYEITSWIWSDGTHGEVLNKSFTSDETVSVTVGNTLGCNRTYSFDVHPLVPPVLILPAEPFCEGTNPEIKYSTNPDFNTFHNNKINWLSDNTIGKDRSFNIPLGFAESFDQNFTLELGTDAYSNQCFSEYTQHFDFYPTPDFNSYDEPACYGGDLTLTAPEGFTNNTWELTNSTESGLFLTLENIVESTPVRLTTQNSACAFIKDYNIGITLEQDLTLLNGNEQTVCYGDDITLTVPDYFSNVTWHIDNSTGHNKTFTNITNDLDLTVSGEYGGCYREANVTITANEPLNITLEEVFNSGESSICENELFEIKLQKDGTDVDENSFAVRNWSNGASSRNNIFTSLSSTSEVSCYVEDYNGCAITVFKSIAISPNPEVSIANQYVCEGEDLTINAGNVYDTYQWWNGDNSYSTSETSVNTPITNAFLTVSEGDCEATAYFEIQTFDVDNYLFELIEICEGETATLTAPAGFTSYRWQDGSTTRSIEVSPSKPASGDIVQYQCIVSDGDCDNTINYEVRINTIDAFTLDNQVACLGELATMEGPTGYDAYAWNYEGQTGKDLLYRTSSNFTASLTVWEGTCSYTATAEVVVEEVEPFNLLDGSVCNDGSITYTAPAGYDYTWSTGESTQSITIDDLSETTGFTIEIEDPSTTCKASDNFIVTVNDFIDFEVGSKEICQGGTAELSVNPIYTSYLWSTGATTANISVSPVALGEHNYTVTVTDFNGCTGDATPVVDVREGLDVVISNENVCIGEFVEIGINDMYDSYSWSNGGTTSKQWVSPNTTTNYTLTVQDNTGCEGSAIMQVIVYEPEEIALETIVACQGDDALITAPVGLTQQTWNGQLTEQDNHTIASVPYTQTVNLTAKDANGCAVQTTTSIIVNRNPIINVADKYMCKFESSQIHLPQGFSSYNWSNGSTESFTTVFANENESHSVVVEDVNGCTATADFDLVVYEYTPIDLVNQEICKGDVATISLSDISGPNYWVSYNWSNGKISQEITESPLKTTDYNIHAKDNNGCTSIGSMTLYVHEVDQYELPNIELCGAGTTTITADPGFTEYLWHTGETSQSIDFTATENELVTLAYKDAKGCQGTTKKIAVVYQKPEIYLNDYTACQGGSVDILAPGGYNYLWDNGETDRTNTVSPTVDTEYTLIVIDNYGCRDTATSMVTIQAAPSLSLTSYNVCPDEVISIDGGAGFNKYFWSNGVIGRFNTIKVIEDRDYTLTVEDIYGCSATATSSVILNTVVPLTLSDISACDGDTIEVIAPSGYDTYEWSDGSTSRTLTSVLSKYDKVGLTVTSANGCTQYREADITSLDKPDYFLASEYIACENQRVDVNIIPGYLRYLWSDGSFEINRTFWPTGSQDYTLEVEGVNGCITTKSTTIREEGTSDIYLADQLACSGANTLLTLENSERLASINWSTGETSRGSIYIKATQDTVISVDYEDYYGCVGSLTSQVRLQPGVAPNLQDVTLCKGETRMIFASGVYNTYKWSNGSTTPTITITGDYDRTMSLEVTDQNGCTYISTFDVIVKEMPELNLRDYTLCYTDTIVIGVINDDQYSYQWNTGESTSYIKKFVNSNVEQILTVTDNVTNCIVSDTANIIVHPRPEFDIPSQFANRGETIILSADASMSNLNWSTGDTNYTITFIADTTTYLTLQAIDENSCTIFDEIFIYVTGPEENMVYADTACSGQACELAARSGFRSYQWSTGETNRAIVKYDIEPSDYQVEITDHAGTTKVFSTRSNIKQGPDINIGDTTLCFGDELTLRVASGNARYLWSTGDETNEITFDNISGTFDFSVLVEAVNGCVEEKSGTASLHPDIYSIVGLKDSYASGEQVNISVSNQKDVESCRFLINGTEYSGPSMQTRIYDIGSVEVSCEVQANNGCYFEYAETITIEATNDLHDSENSYLFVYPNPVVNELTIQVDSEDYRVVLYNSSGTEVYSGSHNEKEYHHDFSSYPEGLYILNVITKEKTYINKIVKE